ncbi:MAG: PIN domain-containing protein [Nanoarchaeota archaeon]|mgnify:CR=1 FL=1
MKCVVDTNVLFSFFKKYSLTRKFLLSSNNFISSALALTELKKYSSLIISKSNISEREFSIELNRLKKYVKFFPSHFYKEYLKLALAISPDKDDADFLALCIKMQFPLWSNDKDLKKQDKVTILSTEDLVNVLF